MTRDEFILRLAQVENVHPSNVATLPLIDRYVAEREWALVELALKMAHGWKLKPAGDVNDVLAEFKRRQWEEKQ